MKKKIIFITEALWIGGIETALINLLNRIDYERYDVTLLVCRGELQLLDRVNRNCRVIIADREKTYTLEKPYRHTRLWHLLEEPQNPSLLHRALMWTVPFLRYAEKELYIRYIKEELSDESFDTAVIYNDHTAEIGIQAVKADKYLLFYHNALMKKAYHDEIAYRKCQAIVAVSEQKAAALRKFRPKYAKKIVAVHNVVDIDAIQSAAGERTVAVFPEDGFHLVTCGRVAHQKAIDWAVTACRILVDQGYSDIHWWIVGDGPEKFLIRKMIADNNLEEHFHMLGMQENPYVYMKQADLYVQPSRYENYSVAILEAMVLCKPILATIPAADQQIIDDVNGKLCEPDPEKIAEAIAFLYMYPEVRSRYTQYLQEHSLEEENQKIMQKLYELF